MEWSAGQRIGAAVLIGLTAWGGAVWLYQHGRRTALAEGALYQPASSPNPAGAYLKVHVAGAVRKPGVYTFGPDDRVFDAIRQAGGELPGARLDDLNLAAHLRDGMRLYIPGKQDGKPDQVIVMTEDIWAKAPPPQPRDAEQAPRPGDQAGRPLDVGAVTRGSAGGHPAAHRGKKEPPGQAVDINTASLDDLQRLPGIGPAMAGRIVAYRATQGRFRSPRDLLQVKGIGDKKLEKLLPYVKVQ